ncbi:MAG: hypothetical protein ACLSAP_05710 [Oscillospiraceae bacterium]
MAGLLTLVFCDHETPFETGSILQVLRTAQQTRYLDSNELMFLPLALKFCCLELAHMACEDGAEERGAALIERAVTGFRAIENIEFADIVDDLSIVESIFGRTRQGCIQAWTDGPKTPTGTVCMFFRAERNRRRNPTPARCWKRRSRRRQTPNGMLATRSIMEIRFLPQGPNGDARRWRCRWFCRWCLRSCWA